MDEEKWKLIHKVRAKPYRNELMLVKEWNVRNKNEKNVQYLNCT
jgi:hypothetical protein